MDPAARLHQLGQSLWLDYIRRDLIDSGELARRIAGGEIRGMTSNPSIFEKAIAESDLYSASLRPLAQAGWTPTDILDALTLDDIRDAADAFRPLYESRGGADGFVSVEVSPLLAHQTDPTLAEARRLWQAVNRPNLMVKIPATRAGLPAIEQALFEGINVNVTLIFSLERYAEVIEAFLHGLERRNAEGRSINHVASVASFFVSRVDTLVDARLDEVVRREEAAAERARALRGRAAIANARIAYAQFLAAFHGDRFEALRARGAQVQRPLWASTSTKDPAYPDTYYVDNLIGPDTVNTLPPETLEAFLDHGTAAPSLEQGLSEARATLDAVEALGISMPAATEQLEKEGVRKFAAAYRSLVKTIGKRSRLAVRELGPLLEPLRARLERFQSQEVVRRLWSADPSLWPRGEDDPSRRLGWLELPNMSSERRALVQALADRVRTGSEHVLLLGMGGSSLASDVIHRMSLGDGRVQLHVLDTTDPKAVRKTAREAPAGTTFTLVASKSGTTAEPLSLMEHFWARAVKARGVTPGERFAALTDPGTPLERLAKERGFAAVVSTPEDVGGRYSALSEFGLVPAASLGVETSALLAGGAWMARRCGPGVPAARNPGLFLGALLGAAVGESRDKVTFVADPELEPFPDWIEQLIAESSGKQGKGIFPIAHEPPASARAYRSDRVLVYLRRDGTHDRRLTGWIRAGIPLVVVEVAPGAKGLGAEFFRWEFATAVACHAIGVNAFDQPDVQRAKESAREAIRGADAGVPQGRVAWSGGGVALWSQATVDPSASLDQALRSILRDVSDPEVVVLLSYLPETRGVQRALAGLRKRIRDRLGAATMLGVGPRYLHSTGQLFKGGPPTLLPVVWVGPIGPDLALPDGGPTLGTLKRAQAVGDWRAMVEAGRPALAVALDSVQQLNPAAESLERALVERFSSGA